MTHDNPHAVTVLSRDYGGFKERSMEIVAAPGRDIEVRPWALFSPAYARTVAEALLQAADIAEQSEPAEVGT